MADQHRYPPAHGDEAELFRAYNDELMRTVSWAIGKSNHEVIEDACAFAWAQFLQYQPDRDRNWQGWLYRTAQRKAWQLEAEQREHGPLGENADDQDFTFSRARVPQPDPHETHMEVDDAFAILDQLPERLRRIALLRALGLRHTDIGELTGDTPTRVGQLIARANMHIYDVIEERNRKQEVLPARAQRLADLEQNPPAWLIARIGRPPRAVRRNVALTGTRRAWRRAALALDDLRKAAGPNFDKPERLDVAFTDLQARVIAAIETLAQERARRARRDLDR